MNSCHYEFYILQFKCLIVVFTITLIAFLKVSLLFVVRQLLYGIAEDLASDDVGNVKFLLKQRLPKNKLQENAV